MSDDSFHFIPATDDQPPATAAPVPTVEPVTVAATPTRKTDAPTKTIKRSPKTRTGYQSYVW